jgi:hypothetical protein
MDARLGEMKVWRKEMQAAQERTGANITEMKAEIRVNNENFEALLGTLVSRMNIHQAG